MSKVVALAIVLAAARAGAQEPPEAGHICVAGACDDGAADSSSDDAGRDARIARMHEAERLEHERSLARELAQTGEQRVKNAKSHNDAGLAAAKRKQWQLAVQSFDDANRLAPCSEYANNLAEAQRELDRQRRARVAALGPPVPPWHPGERVTQKLPPDHAPLIDSHAYLTGSLAYLRDTTNEAADEASCMDIALAEGLFLCVEHNVAKLVTTTIPDWLSRAASGEMSLDEAKQLTVKASAIIFNVGAAPGKYAQRLVEVGSAKVIVVEDATKLATGKIQTAAEDAIVGLAAGLGASVKYKDGPYLWDQVQHAQMKKELEPYARKALAATQKAYDRWSK